MIFALSPRMAHEWIRVAPGKYKHTDGSTTTRKGRKGWDWSASNGRSGFALTLHGSKRRVRDARAQGPFVPEVLVPGESPPLRRPAGWRRYTLAELAKLSGAAGGPELTVGDLLKRQRAAQGVFYVQGAQCPRCDGRVVRSQNMPNRDDGQYCLACKSSYGLLTCGTGCSSSAR